MRTIIAICGDNMSRCDLLVKTLIDRNKNVEILKRITTNTSAGYNYEVVNINKFFDIDEQGRFFEYHEYEGAYYGTPHINFHDDFQKECVMANDIDVVLAIKKLHPKLITIYVLPSAKEKEFKTGRNSYLNKRKLDFLVIDYDLESSVSKIEEIMNFMKENGMQ